MEEPEIDPKHRYYQWQAGNHLFAELSNKNKESALQTFDRVIPEDSANIFNIKEEYQERFEELYDIYSRVDRQQMI